MNYYTLIRIRTENEVKCCITWTSSVLSSDVTASQSLTASEIILKRFCYVFQICIIHDLHCCVFRNCSYNTLTIIINQLRVFPRPGLAAQYLVDCVSALPTLVVDVNKNFSQPLTRLVIADNHSFLSPLWNSLPHNSFLFSCSCSVDL